MSEYFAKINWSRASNENYIDNKYSRGYEWIFDGGITDPASFSPHVVPPPYSVEANVDPEEAFIASLSSYHMLFFLSIAAPHVQLSGDKKPTMEQLEKMHHQAHEQCFIANSVKTEIVTEIIE